MQVRFVVIQTDRQKNRFNGVFIVSLNTPALSHTNPTETPGASCCAQGHLKRDAVSPYFTSRREHIESIGQEVIRKLSLTMKILSIV